MKKNHINDPKIRRASEKSMDPQAMRVRILREQLPEVFAEDKVDSERLQMVLGDVLDVGPERYSFSWAGKRDALRLLQMPTRATLIPVREESVNWDSTENVFIEGDNLEVLKLLLRPYYGRVKMIYIDPPYNTGSDFVYRDNYRDPLEAYLRLTNQSDADGNLLTSNLETHGRYHSSWLSMIYPRLWLARQLLRENGTIIVSIDDREVHNLRMLMNEVFGEEGFVCALIWKRRQNVDSRTKTGVSVDHEYALAYRKTSQARLRGQDKDLTKYSNPDNDPRGPWASDNMVGLATREQRPNLHYDLVNPQTGNVYPCPEAGWRYSPDTMSKLIEDGRVIWPTDPSGRPRLKRYLNELTDEYTGLSSILTTAFNTEGTKELKGLFDGMDIYDFPKPVEYLRLLIEQATLSDQKDIILDFFAGSCTTAHAALELNQLDGGNRRFVMVQLPEPTRKRKANGRWDESAAWRAGFSTIAEIGKERIRRVIARLKEKKAGQLDLTAGNMHEDLGFRVFKLAPSNYRSWTGVEGQPDAEAYMRQMELFTDTLVDSWTPENVIAEVALKEAGFGLDYTVEKIQGVDQTFYRVNDPGREQVFYLCLDDEVRLDSVKPLNLDQETLFICRASALDDNTAANLALQCRLRVV